MYNKINLIKNYCQNNNISWRFIKFLIVGVINTIFNYALYAALIYFGMHYIISTLIATIFGILFNFMTTGRLVFKNKDNKLIFKFILIYCITYLSTILILSIFDKINLDNMYINYAILLPFNAIAAYIMMKKYVFK